MAIQTNLKTEDFSEVLQPNEMMWRLVNHLPDYNKDHQAIVDVKYKLKQLQNNKLFGGFYRIFDKAVEYYKAHQAFPDINWLQTCFTGGNMQILQNVPFTNEIFIDLVRKLDEAILLERMVDFQEQGTHTQDDWDNLLKAVGNFNKGNQEDTILTKQDIIGLQRSYQADLTKSGVVRTSMPQVDDVIGILGAKSLAVFAGGSGSGKTTFALSVAYNAALVQGLCVDYVSYEVQKEQVWQNLVSRHSKAIGTPVKACVYKEGIATESELQTYEDVATDLFRKFNETGGRIDVIDQTTSNGGTFEGFKRMLEAHAEKRGRKADLIIVDNVDNLQILKGGDRDEATRVNNYIIQLDQFTKTYYNNARTCMLLLTQVNRTGSKKMSTAEEDDGEGKGRSKLSIDVTCIQKFNALYEKATVVLGLIATKSMRASGLCFIFPIKLRNRSLPEEPIEVRADYAYSSIGDGDLLQPTLDNTKKELEDIDKNFIEENVVEDDFDFDFGIETN